MFTYKLNLMMQKLKDRVLMLFKLFKKSGTSTRIGLSTIKASINYTRLKNYDHEVSKIFDTIEGW